MKANKILKVLITAITLAMCFPIKITASADTVNYMRVLSSDAIIYADVNFQEPIFTVPNSYYVKIEERLTGAIKVSYGSEDLGCPKIIGYMKESTLNEVSYIPNNPFSIIKVSTDVSDILFNDIELKNPYFNLPKNEIMYYYGDVEIKDKVLCYVYYSKKLGYVDKTSLNPFVITPNGDPIENEQESPETPTDTPDAETPNQSVNLGENLQLIIIVGISIVSISVVYFLFKPSKNKISDDQNEVLSD